MKRIIYCLIFLSGCAALGTSIDIIDKESTNNVKEIYLSKNQFNEIIIIEIEKNKLFIVTEDSAHASAILYCEIGYEYKRYEVGAIANIKLTNNSTGKIIATVKHNTFWGNSYMLPPSIEQATEDAIKGAIGGLAKKIKDK